MEPVYVPILLVLAVTPLLHQIMAVLEYAAIAVVLLLILAEALPYVAVQAALVLVPVLTAQAAVHRAAAAILLALAAVLVYAATLVRQLVVVVLLVAILAALALAHTAVAASAAVALAVAVALVAEVVPAVAAEVVVHALAKPKVIMLILKM